MERTKQKSKKDKPNKYVDKEKPSFIADIKILKENLKIREILRTVRMNSSMRVKAPRGSKVMDKDFNESEDIFEDKNDEGQVDAEPPSATNSILMTDIEGDIVPKEDQDVNNDVVSNTNVAESEVIDGDETDTDINIVYKSRSLSEAIQDCAECDNNAPDVPAPPLPSESPGVITRERKLSLDHKMLSRREGMSQSEADLHTIGKSPLERKSSFFRKKMDSFVKNTTEIFKRQSLGSKPIPSPSVQRRDSTCSRVSISLQSLNENSAFCGAFENDPTDKYRLYPGSITSLRSYTPARSNSSVSVNVSDRPPDMSEESLSDSRQDQIGSQPLPEIDIPGMNEFCKQDSFLNTRAISMSSGLDTVTGQRKRKTSRFNRVSWLASESLTNYFRSLIPDEKIQESQANYLHPDFATPAHEYGPRIDSKGRRLSYVRAVSGEDSSVPSRAQDSSLRRKKNSEDEEKTKVLALLASIKRNGIPNLYGFDAVQMCTGAEALLRLLYNVEATKNFFTFGTDVTRQEAIIELIYTEASYIHTLRKVVYIFIAVAHFLQYHGALNKLETRVLFLNMPDILNANLRFWEKTLYPMLADAKKNTEFNFSLMIPGFTEFAETFDAYEEYCQNLLKTLKHLRQMFNEKDFVQYMTWCEKQNLSRLAQRSRLHRERGKEALVEASADNQDRLEMTDLLVKPVQRITKYSLMLDHLKKEYSTDEEKIRDLNIADTYVKSHLTGLNRSCQQKEEIDIMEKLKVEAFQPDFKGDDEMEKAFKTFTALNLLLPMLDCDPHMIRCLIHEGPLRYKDYHKEFDAHVLLFTDMILICKRKPKTPKNARHWKLQRPKIMLHRLVPSQKLSKSGNLVSLIYVELDDFGSSKNVFQLSETTKDPYPFFSLKVWKVKVLEAMITYTLTKWYYKYPVKDVAIIEKDYNDAEYKRKYPKICALEMRARHRVASMMIPNKRFTFPDAAEEMEIPQTTYERERGPLQLHTIAECGIYNFNAWQARGPNFHQQKKLENNPYILPGQDFSLSGNSHKERGERPLQRSGSSAKQHFPSQTFDYNRPSTSKTVNELKDDDGLEEYYLPVPSSLILRHPSRPGPHRASAEVGSVHTLYVPPTLPVVHSHPDINAEFQKTPEPLAPPETASEKLYRTHQEVMQRIRLAADQHYLSPGHRGARCPPPSPTRPLKRESALKLSSHPPPTRSKNISSFAHSVQMELQKLKDLPRKEEGFDDVSEPREDLRRVE